MASISMRRRELQRDDLWVIERAAGWVPLNSRRKDIRTVHKVISEFEGLPDGAPDPERSALAIREMEQMFAALHALAPRSRAIFLARWRDEKTNEEIATTFGIHKRSVQKDLARTELHLRAMLGRLKQG